jgi:hypothetical protein
MENPDEMEREEEELGESFMRSIWNSSKDVFIAMGDIGLSLVTNSTVLDGIPALGVVAGLAKAAYSLRDRLFLKKLYNFFEAVIKNTTDEKKEEFRRKMESDPELRRRVGENTILLIERHDSFDKSSILGKVFAGWMNGKITYEQFYRIALVIDRAFIDDLVNLKQYYQSIEKYRMDGGKPFREYLDDDKCQSLYNSHLLRFQHNS